MEDAGKVAGRSAAKYGHRGDGPGPIGGQHAAQQSTNQDHPIILD